ncbi:glycosyltransferase family 4 protein [Candidatus Formimonas warabiya]|uniref:Glycosyltransferase family 4 protein n=1 Tax=Formimonas warabiya TaxID=1761012 RepID=A0A3G1KZ92_FORW1|nr:glycosyltransferase family 4 protein [Candidatus Formimonas warabiya]ATW27717.1 hypothetical protein DCMF_25830 [Candidatus Formimonas warabiya]
MIKILQVITLSEIGGAQKVLFDIVRSLNRKESFEFHVACAPGGELVEWLKSMEIKVFELPELVRPISPGRDLAAFIKLHRIIKENKYEVVHCHSSKAGILGRLAAKLTGVPRIVFTVHGWGVTPLQSPLKRFVFGFFERLAGKAATDVICVSKADFEMGKGFVPGKKLKVIYNGVESLKGSPGGLRQEIDVGEKDVIVGMAARLKEPKDPLFLLKTAEKILQKHQTGVYFVLVGDGPLREECDDFIRANKLQSRIHLLGTRPDLIHLYQDFDVFALFSSWEGLPLTICEAMMAGLPVVASQVGGVGEQVTQGWNGFLLDKHDVDKAADYVNRLILNEALRKQMGENSKKRAEELFRIERMTEAYKELYLASNK